MSFFRGCVNKDVFVGEKKKMKACLCTCPGYWWTRPGLAPSTLLLQVTEGNPSLHTMFSFSSFFFLNLFFTYVCERATVCMWKSEDSLHELASTRCCRHQTPTGAFWGNLFLQSPRNLGVATPGCGFTEAVPIGLGELSCEKCQLCDFAVML